MFHGVPVMGIKALAKKLQRVQNTAARLVFKCGNTEMWPHNTCTRDTSLSSSQISDRIQHSAVAFQGTSWHGTKLHQRNAHTIKNQKILHAIVRWMYRGYPKSSTAHLEDGHLPCAAPEHGAVYHRSWENVRKSMLLRGAWRLICLLNLSMSHISLSANMWSGLECYQHS